MASTVTMETSNNSKITVHVTVNDVLCGRRGSCHQHPGNRLFRAMIKENKGTFEALTHEPMRRQMLVESIIQAFQHHGGRFLRKSQGLWIPISEKEAYTKVCHALRDVDHHSSCSSGSDSSSMTSDEGKPSSPQHSQFKQALDKKVKKTLVQRATKKETNNDTISTHNNQTMTKTTTTNNNNNDFVVDQHRSKRGGIATVGSDDIPELVECNNDDKNKNNNHHQLDRVHNKENRQPVESTMDNDDIPEVISVKEGSPQISKNVSFLSEDGDDDEDDSLRPLDPDEFVFESAEEFSHLCVALLQYWGQGQLQ